MSTAVKKSIAVAVEVEDVEGTYKAPTSSSDFVQVLEDGFELSLNREVLERNIFAASIGKTSPRGGMLTSEGTIPAELRASGTEGNAPEIGPLVKAALGVEHTVASTTTTKAAEGEDENTGSILLIEDVDITKFNVGDIVIVKEAGAFHVSPISVVDDTPGAASVTLLIPRATGVFPPSVVISKTATYSCGESGHSPLSISKYIEGTLLETLVGGKVTSLEISQFATAQTPQISFGLAGLNGNQSVTSIPFTPAYQSSLPPIMMDGGLYMNGTKFCANELSLSLENTLGYITCITAENGRLSSRVTDRAISGTINPYKDPTNTNQFTRFKAGTPFSLFAYGKVPTGVAGEFSQVVAIYMPNCVITELTEADQDGVLQDQISFSADRGVAGNINELYMGFI